jgi:hypothetical protein
VPTLDEFVLLHKVLQAAVQSDPTILGLLRGAKRSFGWNVLGEHPTQTHQDESFMPCVCQQTTAV